MTSRTGQAILENEENMRARQSVGQLYTARPVQSIGQQYRLYKFGEGPVSRKNNVLATLKQKV